MYSSLVIVRVIWSIHNFNSRNNMYILLTMTLWFYRFFFWFHQNYWLGFLHGSLGLSDTPYGVDLVKSHTLSQSYYTLTMKGKLESYWESIYCWDYIQHVICCLVVSMCHKFDPEESRHRGEIKERLLWWETMSKEYNKHSILGFVNPYQLLGLYNHRNTHIRTYRIII